MSTPLQETTKNPWSGQPGSWRDGGQPPATRTGHSLDAKLAKGEVSAMLSEAEKAAQQPQPNEMARYVVSPKEDGQVTSLSYVSAYDYSEKDFLEAIKLDRTHVAQKMSTQFILLHDPQTDADEPITEAERMEQMRNHHIFMNRYELFRLLDLMEQGQEKFFNEKEWSAQIKRHQHLENVHLLLSYSEPSVVIFIGLNQDSQLVIGLAKKDVVNSRYVSTVLTDWSFSAKFDEFFAQERDTREIGAFFMERLKELDLPNKATEFRDNPPLNARTSNF